MLEQTETLDPQIRAACDIAAGRTSLSPDSTAIRVAAAHRDLSARGRVRERWYRMRWDGMGWTYFARGSEPRGMRAADRHWTGDGHAWPGDILVQHDHGEEISSVWLVIAGRADVCVECDLSRTRGGLRITLPDGTVVDRPDPRRR